MTDDNDIPSLADAILPDPEPEPELTDDLAAAVEDLLDAFDILDPEWTDTDTLELNATKTPAGCTVTLDRFMAEHGDVVEKELTHETRHSRSYTLTFNENAFTND